MHIIVLVFKFLACMHMHCITLTWMHACLLHKMYRTHTHKPCKPRYSHTPTHTHMRSCCPSTNWHGTRTSFTTCFFGVFSTLTQHAYLFYACMPACIQIIYIYILYRYSMYMRCILYIYSLGLIIDIYKIKLWLLTEAVLIVRAAPWNFINTTF